MADAFDVKPTSQNTLVISNGSAAKQYVGIDTNLFRELDSNLTFGDGISPRLVAFQEDGDGRVTGFVMDEMPFMSLRKKPAYETMDVQKPLLAASFLVFLSVLLRAFYQRRSAVQLSSQERASRSRQAPQACGCCIEPCWSGGNASSLECSPVAWSQGRVPYCRSNRRTGCCVSKSLSVSPMDLCGIAR